jgi:DnaK suppressor protein
MGAQAASRFKEESVTVIEKGLDAVRQRLEAELVGIEKELSELGANPDGSVVVSFDEGFADAAQTTSERAKMLSLIDGLRHRLDDVRAALHRVERGIYGRCERCGKEISPERLEAVPTARLCIVCAQKKR